MTTDYWLLITDPLLASAGSNFGLGLQSMNKDLNSPEELGSLALRWGKTHISLRIATNI